MDSALSIARVAGLHLRPTAPLRRFAPSRGLKDPPRRRHEASVTASAAVESSQITSWMAKRGVDVQQATGACSVSAAGLVTSRAVKKGEQLYSVPEPCWITPQQVASSQLGPYLQDQPPWVQLALFLLHERTRPDSPWREYITSLPPDPNVPVLWSAEELKELEGSQVLGQVEGYRAFFQSKFEELQGGVFAAHPQVFPAAVFDLPAFLWAVCTVRARVHEPLEGDAVALVPFADLTPHVRQGGGQWQVKTSGLFGRTTSSLVMEASRDMAAGAAVGMDYSPGRCDSQVLLNYGVVDSAEPQPGFTITLELPESDRNFDDKLDILEINGLGQTLEFVLRPDEPPSDTLLAFLRLLNLSGADAFLLESLFRNEVWDHLQLPVSEDNERLAYGSMIQGCQAALAAHPTTIDQDLALLRGWELGPGSRRELAVRVRLGEKEALDATLRYFEDRIGRLGGMEYYAERRLKRLGLLDDAGDTTWDGFFKDGVA